MLSSLIFRLHARHLVVDFFFFLKDLFIYFRDTVHAEGRGRGAEGDGERGSQADSTLSVEPKVGLNPKT